MSRMDWWTHACANKHLDARTCTQTDRQTRQTDGRTDILKYTPSRTRACKHTNACNWWTHACTIKHLDARTCGRTIRQTDMQTDGRTDSHVRPHAHAHAHTRTLACLHAHTMHSGTYARTDRHTHTCSYGCKHPSTNMEVRSKKLEVRSKKLEVRSKKLEVRSKK